MMNFEQQEQEIQRLNLRIEELEKKVNDLGEVFLQLGLKLVKDLGSEATVKPAAKAETLIKQEEKTASEILEGSFAKNTEAFAKQPKISSEAVIAEPQPPAEIAEQTDVKKNTCFRRIINSWNHEAATATPAKEAAELSELNNEKTADDITVEAAIEVAEKQPSELGTEQTESCYQDKTGGQEGLQINDFLQKREAFLQKYTKHGNSTDYDMYLDIKKECVKKLLNYPQWEAIPAELLKEIMFVANDNNNDYTYCADSETIDDVFYCFIAPREPADEKFTSRELIRSALPLVFNIDYVAGLPGKAFELVRPAVMKYRDDGTCELYAKGELRLAR